MRCSFKVLLPLVILAIPAAAAPAEAPARYNVGTPLSEAEIKSFDQMIGADGKDLPVGHGTAKEGAVVFANRCEICHGQNGDTGGVINLTAGTPGNPYRGPFNGAKKRTVAFYPYATIAWDFINRAMPASNPGSLTKDEVYAVVAFLYYRNGIIKEDDVLDEKTLPKVVMPNHDGFVPAVVTYPPPKNQPSWW